MICMRNMIQLGTRNDVFLFGDLLGLTVKIDCLLRIHTVVTERVINVSSQAEQHSYRCRRYRLVKSQLNTWCVLKRDPRTRSDLLRDSDWSESNAWTGLISLLQSLRVI